MIVVTGGAGFIGSYLIHRLNQEGFEDILVVDDLTDSEKVLNIRSSRIADYMDKDEFLAYVKEGRISRPEVIFHQGACSNTMETDGKYMMSVNYSYSKSLLDYALKERVPFIYASSASVYGEGRLFTENPENEAALNVYAYSKLQFDNYVRRWMDRGVASQIIGLRYFNVYGPGESHKGNMASVVYHFYNQYNETGRVRLFEGSGGYDSGEQERDFVWVGDIADVNLFFMQHNDLSGIFNVGTGTSRTFNDVALSIINTIEEQALTLGQAVSAGKVSYIPFPENLVGKYQSYTCGDIRELKKAYTDSTFLSVEEGVKEYVKWLSIS